MGTGELTAGRCTVCGRLTRGTTVRSLRDGVACDHHRDVLWCGLCAHVGNTSEAAAWSSVYDDLPRCPTCTRESVRDQRDVRREVPGIRARAKELGFVLCAPVRVGLVSADDLREEASGLPGRMAFGLTSLLITGDRTADVVMIKILAGLPATLFGAVVAHELGHAWLAQHGSRPTEPSVEEGFCELVAHAALKRLDTTFAAGLREQIRRNPDPVYGDGFRRVQAAVRHHGIRNVLACLATTGRLPEQGLIGHRSAVEA